MEKIFSVFIDESGDFGFIKDASKYYLITLVFHDQKLNIFSNIEKPKRVLDLGAGTGLLSYFWYQQCSSAEYVLVDIADEMLNVARKRFDGIDSNLIKYWIIPKNFLTEILM